MIRDAMVLLDGDAAPLDARARYPIDFAVLHKAHLTLTMLSERLFLTAPFNPLRTFFPDQESEDAHDERMRELQATVDHAPIDATIRDIHVEGRMLFESVAMAGRGVDLVLVGSDRHWQSGELRRKVVDALLLHSGSPCLLYPPDGPAGPFVRAVMAWDGSAGAARAVRSLRSAVEPNGHVDILVVDPADHDASGDELAGARIAEHLQRHHFEVELHVCPAGGQCIADVLQSFAMSRSADLLVAGAYGHSQWRERILGGVTRDLIETPRLPILLGG